jgi:hypothetical protein
MAEKRREWTAEIDGNGHGTLWAWTAFNRTFGTFATENPEHARRFDSKEAVAAWIERLKVKDAKPVRLKK